jgi:hypothetical protein
MLVTSGDDRADSLENKYLQPPLSRQDLIKLGEAI